MAGCCECGNEPSDSIKRGEFSIAENLFIKIDVVSHLVR